jgi:N-acyl-D-amino-acid deacylase
MHMRSEGPGEMEALAEAMRIGREANLPVEIFHMKVAGKSRWGNMTNVVQTIQQARDSGLDIAANMYPYVASETCLSAYVPEWVSDGGKQKLLERLKDPAVRARIKKEIAVDDWDNIYFEAGGAEHVVLLPNGPDLKQPDGKTLAAVAAAWNKSPEDTIMDFIVADNARTYAVDFLGSEEDLKTGLAQPWTSIGLDATESSLDGPLHTPHTHPRVFGSMPRLLGDYVRDQHLMTLENAIRKITSLPAQREHLQSRGLLKPGLLADITIFDAATITDHATYVQPDQLSTGGD